MDEIVFLHLPSRTAILADLSENFSSKWLLENWAPWQRSLARLSKIVEGKGYAPLDWRLSFIHRRKLREAKAKVLSWDPRKIIMAHGEWQSENGRQPKAPPAARVMAANALLDRGWGKAVQLQHTDGEIRQLVEVKLNVVQSASHVLPTTDVIDAKPNDIKGLSEDTLCVPISDTPRDDKPK